jgi:hypothetical protein
MSEQPEREIEGQKPFYTYRARGILAAILIALFLIGVAQDPWAVWQAVSGVAVAFAIRVPFLVVGFVISWLFTDVLLRQLLGKSLREMIADKDPQFEYWFTCAALIAMAIILLAAK